MVKKTNHFIFPYIGNKITEEPHIIPYLTSIIDKNNITTIVEPFTGSASLSYMIWKHYPNKKFKYILNDTDKNLINFYNTLKNTSEEDLKKMESDYFDIVKNIQTNEQYNHFIKQEGLMPYFVKYNFYNINPGRFPALKLNNHKINIYRLNILESGIYQFIKNNDIEFNLGDGIPLFDKYKDDKQTLIISDPPYINLCNSSYNYKDGSDMYQYIYNNDTLTYKSHLIFIVQKMWIINLLFEDWNTLNTYHKMYNITKRKVEHVILYNHFLK